MFATDVHPFPYTSALATHKAILYVVWLELVALFVSERFSNLYTPLYSWPAGSTSPNYE